MKSVKVITTINCRPSTVNQKYNIRFPWSSKQTVLLQLFQAPKRALNQCYKISFEKNPSSTLFDPISKQTKQWKFKKKEKNFWNFDGFFLF